MSGGIRLPASMMPDIPTIETARLVLRGHRDADFDAHCAFWADPDVVRFIGGRTFSREESWVRFLRHAGMWARMGFGFWAVTDRASGRFLGEAGFHDLKRAVSPSLEGTMEAGWAILPDVHGRGLGSEVVAAIVGWAAANHAGRRLTCLIDPGNLPSIRLARKHGFRTFAETTYHGAPTVLFERWAGEGPPAVA